jgi:hypothetical protein
MQIELYGGSNSKVGEVPNDATAFANRDKLFGFQFYDYSSDSKPPYPADGFTFLDGELMSFSVIDCP